MVYSISQAEDYMTVKELIERLKDFPEDYEVATYDSDHGWPTDKVDVGYRTVYINNDYTQEVTVIGIE